MSRFTENNFGLLEESKPQFSPIQRLPGAGLKMSYDMKTISMRSVVVQIRLDSRLIVIREVVFPKARFPFPDLLIPSSVNLFGLPIMHMNPDGSYTLSNGVKMWPLDNQPTHVLGRARITMRNLQRRYTAISSRWTQSISYLTLASILAAAISARAENGLPPINICIIMGTGTMCGHSSPNVGNDQQRLAHEIDNQIKALYQVAVFESIIKLLCEFADAVPQWLTLTGRQGNTKIINQQIAMHKK